MPKIKQRRVDRRKKESLYFSRSARNITSQYGEDGILEKIFSIIPVDPLEKWCVEFGAWDGIHYSNTWNLINNCNFNAVMIEGSSRKFQDLLKTYEHNDAVFCLNRIVSVDCPDSTLDTILAETPIPVDFDLLSIDIDGNDYHVWESLVKYTPKVVVIEFNNSISNDVIFIQDCDHQVSQGCSLAALVELGQEKGYELVCVTKGNGIFVLREFYSLFGIKDNSIDAMCFPNIEPRFFQGYDGMLFCVGADQLQWRLKGMTIPFDRFQLLDKPNRIFSQGISELLKHERAAPLERRLIENSINSGESNTQDNQCHPLDGLKFDPIEYVDNVWPELPMMRRDRAQKFLEIIRDNDLKSTLELGFHHGKSSAYTAAILKSLGRGHHIAIDMHYAEPREPNIEQVMQKLDLQDWCTWHYEQHSYTWRLMKFIEERDKYQFDFCYIDGGHVWDVTGYGFLLVDMLLKPGGFIVFDDLDWTIKAGIAKERQPKFSDPNFLEEFTTTPQVRKVFQLIVGQNPNYKCEEWRGWGIARKL